MMKGFAVNNFTVISLQVIIQVVRVRVHATATKWTLAKRPDHVAIGRVEAEQNHHSHGNLEGGEHGRFRFVMRERQSAATEQLMEP